MKGKFIIKVIAFTLFITGIGPGINAFAEEAAGKTYEQLGDITVSATRVDKSLYEIPASVGYVGIDDIQLGTQQLGLDESLVKMPGIFMQNRYNFAQDLRVSIRGFGARSAFGIRGVKIFVDGIPATLPDGQGGVDSIDLGSTERIEVLRGPASSLYGTAAGGVINIHTEDGPEDTPFVEGRASFGSYDFLKYQVKAGGQTGPLNYLANLSRLELDGYRDRSHTENILLNSKFRYDMDSTSNLTATVNLVDSPIADDPGGLTESQVEVDPKQARALNVTRDSGESVDQQQLGFIYRKAFGTKHEFMARNYYVWRNFANKLPINKIVEFDRFFVGGGAQYSYSDAIFGRKNRLIIGFDIDSQSDDRRNFGNNSGAIGALTLSQEEDVDSWGIYAQDEFNITENLQATFGVRYDEIDFKITDKFLSNGDGSGDISFDEWSPQVGLLWHLNDAVNIFGNISHSFETPTTTEFVNPTGGGGFNPDLVPQTATNYEIGVKGYLPGKLSYELALFAIDMEDELVQLENLITEFFTNAGESTRKGVEAGLSVQPLPGLTVSLNYTYSDFEYDKYTTADGTFDGNRIPGIPQQMGYAEVSYFHPSGFYGKWDVQVVDKVFADDVNSASADGYTVTNLRAGYTGNFGNMEVSPYIAINNLLDEEYIGNVRLNAFGSRYFEPAPELNFHAGISVRYQ